MNLFGEFEKRRGFRPPLAVPKKAGQMEALKNTWQALSLAFAGRLRHSCLIPVLPDYQAVFGDTAIWICPDEDKARLKQKTGQIAFSPDELQDIIRIAAQDKHKAASIIAVKKTFGGVITR